MLYKGKVFRYLLYAIGEIVLVVIGILIALYINNVNEDKKSREFEREILDQVLVNLEKDQESLMRIKQNFEEAIRSSDRILETVESHPTHDSLKFWLADVIQFDRFQPITNAYEQLKSKGFDYINNRDLRFLLGTYYDDEANHMIKSIMDIEYAFNTEWIPIVKRGVQNFVFKRQVVLNDFSILQEKQPAGTILKLNKDNYRGGIHRISQGLNTIRNLQDKIKNELALSEF